MDSRQRVLVVEDNEIFRATLVSVLRQEGWRADGAAALEAANEAIDRCTYHVALVDINLADEGNTENRDGVVVLRRLIELNEGTRPVVLSGADDKILLRDLLQEGLTPAYIFKSELHNHGMPFLVSKVREAMAASTVGTSLTWEGLVGTVAQGLGEQAFVSECLRFLSFKGGFENLEKSLLAACTLLVPLIPQLGTASAMARDGLPEALNGKFWSKGQGQAIELLLHGSNASGEAIESTWRVSQRDELYGRTKGDLAVLVVACPELTRDQFGAARLSPT